MGDPFFTKENCDRCRQSLKVRTMSWFTDEVICGDCSMAEKQLKQDMIKRGMDPREYEGCGKVPQLTQEAKSAVPET